MIRKATTDDITAIKQMAEIVFPETYKDIHTPGQTEYMMDKMYSEDSLTKQMTEQGHIFFIEDGVGYASFRHEERKEDMMDIYHLEKLYVLPRFQGKGYGRALFEKILESIKALSNGPVRIELNVNRANKAVSFYEHIGMHREKTEDFSIGGGFTKNDYIMAIEL